MAFNVQSYDALALEGEVTTRLPSMAVEEFQCCGKDSWRCLRDAQGVAALF